MFCTKCGFDNVDGSQFCASCGQTLNAGSTPRAPQPVQSAPATAMQRPKARRTGLIIALVIIGVIVLAGIALLVLWLTGVLFTAGDVVGVWYSDEREELVEFETDGDIEIEAPYGDFDGEYEFDKGTQQGVITIDGTDYDFVVVDDVLTVEEIGRFYRDKDGDKEYNSDAPDIGGTAPNPTKPSEDLGEFDAQTGVIGTWYSESGEFGIVEFYKDGTVTVSAFGIEFGGMFTFDAASGQGTITIEAFGETDTSDFALTADGLEVDGVAYTRDYVEQMDLEDAMGALEDLN